MGKSGTMQAEFATGSGTALITDKGIVISSGYLPANTNQSQVGITNISFDPFYSLGTDLYGNRDVLVLAMFNLSATPAVAYSSLTYKEIL